MVTLEQFADLPGESHFAQGLRASRGRPDTESGAVDYIAVPVAPEVLRAKVGIFAELLRKTAWEHMDI